MALEAGEGIGQSVHLAIDKTLDKSSMLSVQE